MSYNPSVRLWRSLLWLMLCVGLGAAAALLPSPSQKRVQAVTTPAQVRQSIQKSIDFLTTNAQAWDAANQCYGCHVQAQTARALAIGVKNQYNVNMTAFQNTFMWRMLNQQVNGGVNADCHTGRTSGGVNLVPGVLVHDPCHTNSYWIRTPATILAAPTFAMYNQFVGGTYDTNLVLIADYLARTDVQNSNGSWSNTSTYFPADTWADDFAATYEISEAGQSIQFTTNAMMAIRRANAVSPKAAYTNALNNGLAYLRSRAYSWSRVQEGTHLIMGLIYGANVSGTDADVTNTINTLISWQNANGGWGRTSGWASEGYHTGQVLNAMEAIGITMFSEPTGVTPNWIVSFNKAVDWIVANQAPDGSFGSAVNDRFVNTMWAVVGTGAAFGPLTVSITNPSGNGAEAATPFAVAVNAQDNDGAYDVQRMALYLEDLSASGPTDPPDLDTGWVSPGSFSGAVGNRTWSSNTLAIPATPGRSFKLFARAWNTRSPAAYYDSTPRIIHNISSTLSTATAGGGPSAYAVVVKASGSSNTADAIVTLKTTGNQPAAGRVIKITTTFGTIVAPPGDTLITDANGQATFKISSASAGSGVITIQDITNSALGVTVTLSSTPGVSFYSVGGFVFDDTNKNGVKDSGEVGIPGAAVKLHNGSNTTTLPDGFYFFGDPISSYTVTQTDKTGYGSSTDNIVTLPNAATDHNFGDYSPVAAVTRNDWARYHDYGTAFDNQGYNGNESQLTFNSTMINAGREWTSTLASAPIGGPIVANGMAFVVTGDSTLRAINLSNQNQAWAYSLGSISGGIAPTYAVIDGVPNVIIGNALGTVYRLNASTGALIHSFSTGGGAINSSPVVANGTVYVASSGASGSILAYDVETRKIKWKYTGFGSFTATGTMALRNNRLFVPLVTPAKLAALDVANGNKLWEYPLGSDTGVATDANNVYLVHGGSLAIVSQATGAGSVVTLGDGATSTIPIVTADNRLLIGGGTTLKAYNTSGGLLWSSANLGSLQQQSPILANNRIYVASGTQLYGLNAADGTTIWSYALGSSVPGYAGLAALNDRLYVPAGSQLLAFHRVASLSVSKAVFSDTALTTPALSVQPAQSLWYRMTITNNGENQANNVVLRDRVPAGASYVSGSAAFVSGSGTVTEPANDKGTVQWSLGSSLAKGASVVVKYQVTVD